MADPDIRIKYDGGDASRNYIDAKLLGQSLQGLDRMVSDCLIILSTERMPKRGERAPVILKVKEPVGGSYDLPALAQEISTQLGIGLPILSTIGSDIISHYIKAVLDYFSGDEDVAIEAIRAMAEMHRIAVEELSKASADMHETTRETEANRHQEQMAVYDLLRHSMASSGAAAVNYVAPIGQSVDSASFFAGKAPVVEVKKPQADAIRESQKLDWSSVQNMLVETDGFKFHSSDLSIKNPDKDGFMMADVVDPAFEAEGNAYTVAAQKRGTIEVSARRGCKNGQLSKIQILDFVREVDGNAS